MSMLESGIRANQQTPEIKVDEWMPIMTLRPHHAVFSERIKSAVTLTARPKPPFVTTVIFQKLNMFGGYIRDQLGTTVSELREQYKKEAALLDYVETLPDEAKIKLDIEPDDFCKSCVVGKHCTATNYKAMIFPHTDTVAPEQDYVSKVHSALLENGYEEGEDFIFRKTAYTFYDFDGGNFKNVKNPQPVLVNFNSMIVKMGALRKAVQTMPNV